MRKFLCGIILPIVFAVSCSHWKISELKGKKIFSLEQGSDNKQIALHFGNADLLDMTFSIQSSREHFFAVDNKLKRIQIFDAEGAFTGSIGAKKVDLLSLSSSFTFGTIGSVAMDSEGKVYVQNRIDLPNQVKNDQAGDVDIASSYMLIFDKTGKLQYSLGQKGAADIPFNYIDKIFVDNDDRLFVITKNYETWGIYRFKSRVRDFFVTLGKDNFKDKDNDQEYNGIIENISPFRDGERFLISVAYYSGTRFKYRKILEFSIRDNKVSRLILQLPDPKNELYTILDDKYLLLWDTDEKALRFAIWDLDGNIVNNLRLKTKSISSYLTQIFTDESGRLFTYSVRKNGVDVMEWK
ncbi:MAG TPA: hypothetical protein VF857_01085 [Spirochaetota bacterium]